MIDFLFFDTDLFQIAESNQKTIRISLSKSETKELRLFACAAERRAKSLRWVASSTRLASSRASRWRCRCSSLGCTCSDTRGASGSRRATGSCTACHTYALCRSFCPACRPLATMTPPNDSITLYDIKWLIWYTTASVHWSHNYWLIIQILDLFDSWIFIRFNHLFSLTQHVACACLWTVIEWYCILYDSMKMRTTTTVCIDVLLTHP